MKLSIIIPVFNEERTIAQVISNVWYSCYSNGYDFEIIVSDDGSNDNTSNEIAAVQKTIANITSVRNPLNCGKGQAIRHALPHVHSGIIIIQDADLEYSPGDYKQLLQPILDMKADVVYGSRFLGAPHRSLYFWHQLANNFLTFLTNLVCDLNLSDMETGLKAFRTDKLKNLNLRENDFRFEPEVTIKLAKAGAKFYEIAASYNGRTYQEGKKIRWYDGFKAVWCILKWGILA